MQALAVLFSSLRTTPIPTQPLPGILEKYGQRTHSFQKNLSEGRVIAVGSHFFIQQIFIKHLLVGTQRLALVGDRVGVKTDTVISLKGSQSVGETDIHQIIRQIRAKSHLQ